MLGPTLPAVGLVSRGETRTRPGRRRRSPAAGGGAGAFPGGRKQWLKTRYQLPVECDDRLLGLLVIGRCLFLIVRPGTRSRCCTFQKRFHAFEEDLILENEEQTAPAVLRQRTVLRLEQCAFLVHVAEDRICGVARSRSSDLCVVLTAFEAEHVAVNCLARAGDLHRPQVADVAKLLRVPTGDARGRRRGIDSIFTPPARDP